MPSLVFHVAAMLAAGLGCGLAMPPSWAAGVPALVCLGLVVGLLAHAHGCRALSGRSFGVAGCCLASLYGAHAHERALHTPLRALLDAQAGGYAIEAAAVGKLDEPIVVEGRLRQDAIRTADGVVLRIDVERVWWQSRARAARGGVSLGVAGVVPVADLDAWAAGRRVRAPALLRRPATYRNAGLGDQERALARRGITLVGTIKSGTLVDVVARGAWWDEWAAGVRRCVRGAVARWLAPQDARAAAVALAILIGDRAGLESDVERTLQEAGTYHVVAISGGNVAIFAGVILGTLGLVGWRGRGAALAGIVTIAAYGLVAEGGASVTRATVIAVIYLGVRMLDLRTPPMQALALSAIGILLVDPLTIGDVGFWLTFGASAAIVLGAGNAVLARPWWVAATVGLLAASIAVEIVLMPIVALVFQRVTLAGLALNFAAIPSMTLVQVSAMTLVAVDALGLERCARVAAWLVEIGAAGLLGSATFVHVAPWLTWRVPPPALAVLAVYYPAVAWWWWRRSAGAARGRGHAHIAGRVALVMGVVIAAAPQTALVSSDGRLRVTFFDVGQGDAMLVTFPNGRTLMVDAGGLGARSAFDMGERVLGPALRARGLRRLDYLAITHGDPDHIGGGLTLVRDFSPREIWTGVPVANHAPTAALRDEAERIRSSWRTVQRGDRLEIGPVIVRVLHPPPPDWERQRVRNDDSLVLSLEWGEAAFVLTGDIGRDVERELIPLLPRPPMAIMKVSHHGSATSSSEAFLNRLVPTFAFVGAGRGNIYGHPVPAVLQRYRDVRAVVFRTDRNGEIELASDGRSIWVTAFN